MKRFISDIKKYYKYTLYSAKAELKSEVADSYLGWIWWFLEPICFMFVYAFMVTVIFKAREPYMIAFVFIGNAIWTFFSKTITSGVKIVSSNKNIVAKVYIPKYMLVLVKILVNSFKLLISFGIVAVIMALYKVPLTLHLFEIIPVVITLVMATFGMSTILAHFGVFVDDLSNIIGILLKLVFYFSGIFYSVATRIPAPYGYWIARLNPVAFVIEQSRRVLLTGLSTNYMYLITWFIVSVILCIIGIKLIYKYENSYVKVI